MRALVRTLIGAAGLVLFVVGIAAGVVSFVLQLQQKVSGGVFGDGANDSIGMMVFGVLGGMAWLLADIDKRLEQIGPRI